MQDAARSSWVGWGTARAATYDRLDEQKLGMAYFIRSRSIPVEYEVLEEAPKDFRW
jgi:hypothetical protein